MVAFTNMLKRKAVKPVSLQVAGWQVNAEAGFKTAMSEAKLVDIGSFRRFE